MHQAAVAHDARDARGGGRGGGRDARGGDRGGDRDYLHGCTTHESRIAEFSHDVGKVGGVDACTQAHHVHHVLR